MDKKMNYKHSRGVAKREGELGFWRESHSLDVGCAGTISRMIAAEGGVSADAAQRAIDEYGYDRVNRVVANSIQRRKTEPGLDPADLKWARTFYIPMEKYKGDDVRQEYVIRKATPEQLSALAQQARSLYEALGLFQSADCIKGHDLENRVVVLTPGFLKDEYKHPEDQLVLATGGFGCNPTAGGRKIFGTFLKDGEQSGFVREDFLGELRPELLPEWAKANLAQMFMERSRSVSEPRYYAVVLMSGGESVGPVNLRDEQDALNYLNIMKDYQDRIDFRQMDGTCLATVEHGKVTYAAEGALRDRLETDGPPAQEQGGAMTPTL